MRGAKSDTTEVMSNRTIGDGYNLIRLRSDHVPVSSIPGQFVMVAPSLTYDPLLKRPFAIFRTGREWFEILVRTRGRGTRALADCVPGDRLEFIGPLGNGYPPAGRRKIILVGGGIGIASMRCLMDRLDGNRVEMFYGIKSSADSCLLKFLKPFDGKMTITSDDGCAGRKGFVTDALEKRLAAGDTGGAVIYACGPAGMLRRNASIAKEHGLKCFISIEERMACGVGACLGCAVRSSGGGSMKHVCIDGPVFEAGDVNLEAGL